MKKWVAYLLIIGLFLIPIFSFGFTLTVTPTAETCNGNGSLAFNCTNTDPNGTIIYLIYKLPNTSIPFDTVNTTVLNGLSSGDYRVIAKETVGSITTEQQQDVTIASSVVPLSYTVQSLNQACSNTSNISINVLTGNAASYEIFSGPMLFPLQTSNTFSGLTVGVYRVRVFNTCGVGIVQTFTVTLNVAGLTIAPPTFSNTVPASCTFTIVNNTISPATGTVIGYPLTIQYTVHPPGGAPDVIINNSLATGNPTSQNLSATIPFYLNQSYSYDISIKDSCGKTYSNNFPANQDITLIGSVIDLECNQNYFTIASSNFTPPYTLTFNTFPAGFNPAAYNTSYPGPYNVASVDFGSLTLPTPKGNYEVTILDACGRTVKTSFSILSVPPKPTPMTSNNGCIANSGRILINLLSNYHIATAIITAAPANYGFPLPHDVSSSVDNLGVLILNPMPLGDYTFQLSDTCNDVILPVNATIPVYVDQGLSYDIRQGCDLQNGSIRISSNNAKLISVIITAAPSGFSGTLPFNATTNITGNGVFYLDNLPAGNYTFTGTDECSFTNSINVVIAGYTVTSTTFSLNPNCGSFDIPLAVINNGNSNETFWLQKLLNATTNTWGHPDTKIEYVNGTVPNATNSFSLNNNTTNYNLIFNGTFRIVHSFSSYNNGVAINAGTVPSEDKKCIEFLSPTLEFNQALEITDAYRIPCSASGSLDVIIKANGTAPLHYSIITKDGAPFSLDNGNSNVFPNLASGIYTFQVEDICGGIKNKIFNVSALGSLVNNNKPCDVLKCVNIISGNETFDLSALSSAILGNQSTTEYTLTYYTTLNDAQLATNPIPNLASFNPTTNPQTIYTRLVFNQVPNCYESNSFDLIVGITPKINLQPNDLNCTETPVDLDVSPNNLATTTYLWSNGATTPKITVTDLGVTNLTVTATNSYGMCNNVPLTCTTTKAVTVIIPEIPVIKKIEIQDWTVNENSIQVITSNNNSFEYSLDNLTFQDSNLFSNLEAGLYTVYVRNKYGCKTISQEVWLLYYPHFFTPNDDGYNDFWYIKNASFEPDFKVFIYDRYGKLITFFKSNSAGWDGNYNGRQLVATDYWFVVYRQDGRIHKGHFSLLR